MFVKKRRPIVYFLILKRTINIFRPLTLRKARECDLPKLKKVKTSSSIGKGTFASILHSFTILSPRSTEVLVRPSQQ